MVDFLRQLIRVGGAPVEQHDRLGLDRLEIEGAAASLWPLAGPSIHWTHVGGTVHRDAEPAKGSGDSERDGMRTTDWYPRSMNDLDSKR